MKGCLPPDVNVTVPAVYRDAGHGRRVFEGSARVG